MEGYAGFNLLNCGTVAVPLSRFNEKMVVVMRQSFLDFRKDKPSLSVKKKNMHELLHTTYGKIKMKISKVTSTRLKVRLARVFGRSPE